MTTALPMPATFLATYSCWSGPPLLPTIADRGNTTMGMLRLMPLRIDPTPAWVISRSVLSNSSCISASFL